MQLKVALVNANVMTVGNVTEFNLPYFISSLVSPVFLVHLFSICPPCHQFCSSFFLPLLYAKTV
jgi:hypothetical protein